MQNIRIDLTHVANMDPMATGHRVATPRRFVPPPFILDQVTAGLREYSSVATRPGAAILGDLLSPRSHKPAISFVGAIKKAVFPPSRDVTVAFGPGFSTDSVITVGASGGVYGWYKAAGLGADIGLYGTWNVGVTSNVSFAVQGIVTYMWCDAPTYFFGDCILVGVDLSTGPTGIGAVSGYLIFTNPVAGPLYFVGISFGIGIGWSVAPIDVTVQFTRTYKGASTHVGGRGAASRPRL
jgi:hypothetical protein